MKLYEVTAEDFYGHIVIRAEKVAEVREVIREQFPEFLAGARLVIRRLPETPGLVTYWLE